VRSCQLLLERRSCLLRCVEKTRRRKTKRFDIMENMKDQSEKINVRLIVQLGNEAAGDNGCSCYKMMMMMMRTLGIIVH
jgi:hypothetical protein